MASVLIIAFVVTIGMLMSGWLRSYSSDVADKTSEVKDTTYECLKVRPRIYRVDINRTAEDIKAYINNAGASDIKFVDARAYDNDGNLCSLNFNETEIEYGETTFASNTTCEIFSTDCADFSEVVITTTCGESTNRFTSEPTTCNN